MRSYQRLETYVPSPYRADDISAEMRRSADTLTFVVQTDSCMAMRVDRPLVDPFCPSAFVVVLSALESV